MTDRKVDSRGYVAVRDERGWWVAEHRRVAERELGRPLRRGEYVHHINEDKVDNRPDNLLVCSAKAHRAIHAHYDRLRREVRQEVVANLPPGPIEDLLERHRAASVAAEPEERA